MNKKAAVFCAGTVALLLTGTAVAARKGEIRGIDFFPTTPSNRDCMYASYASLQNSCGSSRTIYGVIKRVEFGSYTYDTHFTMYANDSSRVRFIGMRGDDGWMWTSGWKDSNEPYDQSLQVSGTAGWDTYVPSGGYMLVEAYVQNGGRMLNASVSR